MYQLILNKDNTITCVGKNNVLGIPFSPDNTDYQQFKKNIQNGVALNDATGNPITGTALTTFISTLP